MNSLSTNPKVLLCTRYKKSPKGFVDMLGYNIQKIIFSPSLPRNLSMGLRFIKQNVPQIEILEFPLWDQYVSKLKEGWDIVGFSFYQDEIDDIEKMAGEARRHNVGEIWAGNYGALDDTVTQIVDRVFIGPAEDYFAKLFGNRVLDNQVQHPAITFQFNLKPVNRTLMKLGFLYTKHGCPFKCSFCQTPAFENRLFNITIESIEEVLIKYKKMGINHLIITDELFGADPDFSEQICELFARFKFFWFAQSRAAIFSHHLDTWYERGLRAPSIGAEAMNQNALNDVNKLQHVDEIIEFARRTNEKRGMYRMVNYMIGYENMTVEDTVYDIERINKLGFEAHGINIITPFPKTPLWDKIESKYGIFEHSHSKYDTKHLVWNHPFISPDQMHRLHKKAIRILNNPFKTYFKFITCFLIGEQAKKKYF